MFVCLFVCFVVMLIVFFDNYSGCGLFTIAARGRGPLGPPSGMRLFFLFRKMVTMVPNLAIWAIIVGYSLGLSEWSLA